MKNDFIKVTKTNCGTQIILPTESILCVCVAPPSSASAAIKGGDTIIVLENYEEDKEVTSKVAVKESVDAVFRMLHLGEWKNNE